MDALRGLGQVSIAEREEFRITLQATLIKNTSDIEAFEEEFERFFCIEDFLSEAEDGDGGRARVEGVETDISIEDPNFDKNGSGQEALLEAMELFEEEKLKASKQMHQDEADVAFSAMSQQLVLNAAQEAVDEAMNDLTTQINVSRLSNPGALGSLAPGDPAATMDMELDLGALDRLRELVDQLDVDEEVSEKLRAQIDGAIERLPELLQRYLEKLMAEKGDARPRAEDVSPMYRIGFTDEEQQQMEELLRRLSRKMNGVLSNRRDAAYRGRINIARTMRHNMKYQGIPFRPFFASRKEDRPRLVVLADVSLSVRNTARFALHLVHNLQSFFSNVRTFAFVSDLVEVTEYFEHSGLEEVLGMIFGGEILDVDANSNYGFALENFHQRHLSAINQRTTVLILGDGRGNGHPANAWVLEEIGRRARQLIWFTPEKRPHWDLGGSDMPTYAELCDRVEVVRSLDQFDEVVDEMVTGALTTR